MQSKCLNFMKNPHYLLNTIIPMQSKYNDIWILILRKSLDYINFLWLKPGTKFSKAWTLQIFTPWKLRGLEIMGSLHGKSAPSMEKGCKQRITKKLYVCCGWTPYYSQITGKPHDNDRISPQSVSITVFTHNRENLQRPFNAL